MWLTHCVGWWHLYIRGRWRFDFAASAIICIFFSCWKSMNNFLSLHKFYFRNGLIQNFNGSHLNIATSRPWDHLKRSFELQPYGSLSKNFSGVGFARRFSVYNLKFFFEIQWDRQYIYPLQSRICWNHIQQWISSSRYKTADYRKLLPRITRWKLAMGWIQMLSWVCGGRQPTNRFWSRAHRRGFDNTWAKQVALFWSSFTYKEGWTLYWNGR